jgi:hypothetical protein
MQALLGVAILLLAVALAAYLDRRSFRRRVREREQFRHALGPRQWWKHPEGEEPEDY